MNLCNKHIIDFACSLSSAQVTGWSLWLLWGSFTNLPQDHLIIHTAKFLTNVLLWGPFDCSPTVSSAQSQVADKIWRRGDNWAKWMTGQCEATWSWIFIQPVHSTTHSRLQGIYSYKEQPTNLQWCAWTFEKTFYSISKNLQAHLSWILNLEDTSVLKRMSYYVSS